jgi:hypothetical protein
MAKQPTRYHMEQWQNSPPLAMAKRHARYYVEHVICEREEAAQQPATPNLARKEPNEWKSIFIVNLTLTSKYLFG